MKFLRNTFNLLLFDSNKEERQKSFEPLALEKMKLKQIPKTQANTESVELTQDQLAEVLSWLSLY